MRQERTMVVSLDVGDQLQGIRTRVRAYGQDHLQQDAQLRDRQGWSFFFPSGFSGARERNAPPYT
jgi:hypothetical protein